MWFFGKKKEDAPPPPDTIHTRAPKWLFGSDNPIYKPVPAVSPLKPPAKDEKATKVKCDTDHQVGPGNVAITGRFDTKGDTIVLESAYALSNSLTTHARYGVTDERILGIGAEARLNLLRPTTIDINYVPASDTTNLKAAVKLGAAKLAAYYAFDGVRARGTVSKPSSRYELEAKLSSIEKMKIAYNVASNAVKLKLARRLDPHNRLNLELNYPGSGKLFGVVSLDHKLAKRHTVTIASNYGKRKYSVEWDFKTNGGPWTISTDFSFDKSPHIGDWHVKRRFEF